MHLATNHHTSSIYYHTQAIWSGLAVLNIWNILNLFNRNSLINIELYRYSFLAWIWYAIHACVDHGVYQNNLFHSIISHIFQNITNY